MNRHVGLLGFGYAVPPHVRRNDDSIFNELRGTSNTEVDLFAGAIERRYLKSGESIEDLMIDAGKQAIADAGLEPTQIDRIYGCAFVSEYITPNGLYKVHHGLQLRQDSMVVPLNCEYSNFATGLVLAQEAIASGNANYVMVNCGASMTRHMDYSRGHSVSVGDGAGAAIVGSSKKYRVIDYETKTLSEIFDVINVKVHFVNRGGGRAIPVNEIGLPIPINEIKEEGLRVIVSHGAEEPLTLIRELLRRHRITSDEIAMIGHQPTRRLMDYWRQAIQPAEYKDTYDEFGNVTVASAPITLARCRDTIRSRFIVIVSPGTGTHFTSVLIER